MIVGTPRSGTTLVQRLACELAGVAVPPETHFFSLLAPGLLRRREFPLAPRAVIEELRRFAALKTSSDLALDPSAAAARLPHGANRALDLFAAILAELAPGAAIIGEKTPNHLLWWRPLAHAAADLRFVVVVRDPRGVVASYRTAWGARDHAVVAERWRSDQEQASALLRAAGPQRALLLRYEDVVVRPGEARERLGALVGSAPGARERPGPPLALDWEVWKRGAAADIDPTRATAWRDVLGGREAADVAAIAGAGMQRFGYAAPGRISRAAARARLPPRVQRGRARFRVRRGWKLRRNARLGRRLR